MKIPKLLSGFLIACMAGCTTGPGQSIAPDPRMTFDEKVNAKSGFGDRADIPMQTGGIPVDYQSDLKIKVNPAKFVQPSDAMASAQFTDAERSRLNDLNVLSDATGKYLAALEAYEKSFATYSSAAAGGALSPAAEADLDKARSDRIRTEGVFIRAIISYRNNRIAELQSNPASILALRKRYDSVLVKGNVSVFLNGDAMGQLLHDESSAVLQQARERIAQIQLASGYLLVQAKQHPKGGDESPLHVDGYDTRSDLGITQEPRIVTQISQQTKEDLKTTEQIATALKQIKSDKSGLSQLPAEFAKAMGIDLNAWKTAIDGLTKNLTPKLSSILAAVKKAEGSTLAQTGPLHDALTKLDGGLSQIQADVGHIQTDIGQINDSVKNLDKVDPATDASTAIFSAANAFADLPSDVLTLVNAVNVQLTAVSTGLDSLPEQLKDLAVNPDFADLAKEVLPTTAGDLDAVIKQTVDQFPLLASVISGKLTAYQQGAVASGVPDIASDPTLITHKLSDPPPVGTIALSKNVTAGDDIISVTAVVADKNADGTLTVRPNSRADQQFDIEKMGFVGNWSADLIFVDRMGHRLASEPKVKFTPEPSLSLTLHYVQPPDRTTGKGNPLFDDNRLIGFGINVTSLDFDGGSTQIGVGVHGTLFNDLLLAGYGVNLNASRNQGYFYAGISIIQALQYFNVPRYTGLPLGH